MWHALDTGVLIEFILVAGTCKGTVLTVSDEVFLLGPSIFPFLICKALSWNAPPPFCLSSDSPTILGKAQGLV